VVEPTAVGGWKARFQLFDTVLASSDTLGRWREETLQKIGGTLLGIWELPANA
jgi:hypothetical protein